MKEIKEYCIDSTPQKLSSAQRQLVNAYHDLIVNYLDIFEGKNDSVDLVSWREVAEASCAIGKESFYRPILDKTPKYSSELVIDLGCGAGSLCLEIIGENGHGIGIDRTDEAVNLAFENAAKSKKQDRFRAFKMDAIDLLYPENQEILKDASIILANFIFHDIVALHGKKTLIKLLRIIHKKMDPDGRLFISEASRTSADSSRPIFAKIFTLIHFIQKIELPMEQEWRAIFAAAGFVVEEKIDNGMPGGMLYILKKGDNNSVQSWSVPIMQEVEGHFIPVPFYYLSEHMNIAAVDLGSIPNSGPAEPHRHDRDEFYRLVRRICG